MSEKELKQSVQAMRTLQAKHEASPKAALAFLVRAGIATKAKKLTKPYKQSA